MAYRYHIFCRSPEAVTRADLVEFLNNDFDFKDDHAPRFSKAKDGGELDVFYDDDAGLIQFSIRTEGPSFDGTIEETIDKLDLPGALAKRLRATRTLITIQPHPAASGKIEKDIWGTLACVEKFLLRERDGVLYNHLGLYDANDRTLAATK